MVTTSTQCPPGKRAIGGGYYYFDSNIEVHGSYPNAFGTAWVIVFRNGDLFTRHFAQPYAMCAVVS